MLNDFKLHGLRFVFQIAAVLTLVASVGSFAGVAVANDVVVVKGTIASSESNFDPRSALYQSEAAVNVLTRIMTRHLDDAAQNAVADAITDSPPAVGPGDGEFTIHYSPSTMRMDQGDHTFMIVIGNVHIGYFMWDRSDLTGMSDIAEIQGRVNLATSLAPFDVEMIEDFNIQAGAGEPVTFQGLTASPYTYDYKGALALGPVAAFAGSVEIHTDGNASIVTGVPGEDVIKAFYQNFATSVSQSPGVSDYFAGLMASQLGLIQKGLPIINTTTTVTKIRGNTVSRGVTTSTVTSIAVERWGPDAVSGYLSDDAVPENINMTSLPSPGAAGTAGADAGGTGSRGAAGAGGAQAVPEACDCSCEAFKKVQGMSKKERKAMQKSPQAMAMAMCMGQCMSSWMGCAQR